MTALQFAIHQVALTIYNCSTIKAIEDLGPSGVICTYVRLNEWCGVKIFRKPRFFRECLTNHLSLLKDCDAAPLLFGTVTFDNPKYGEFPGILVEHVPIIASLGENWYKENRDGFKEFVDNMYEYFGYDSMIADDLHDENVAYKNGKFLMIDFSL